MRFMQRIALSLIFVLSTVVPDLRAQSAVRQLANGVEVTVNGGVIQVTALRDDILRVRASRSDQLSEDASWAVLPESRRASVRVVPDERGFHTAKLGIVIAKDGRITVSDSAGQVLCEDARPIEWRDGRFKVVKRKGLEQHFFGLGDKPGPLDRSGEVFVDWNSDTFGWQESTDPIYKSIPFFLSMEKGRALGVLFDNTWRTIFDFGKESPYEYSFGAPDGPVDYYMMYGPEPKQVVEDYAWLTGPTPLPPMWALGFQQSRYSYETKGELMGIADRLRADHIPADALYLDIDYQQKNRPFTIDEVKFPNFSAMVKELTKKEFHLVVITDLHIAHLPDAGYAPYDSGVAGDHFVKNPDGTTYVGPVWPGPSVFPDFTQQQTRKWWGELYKDFTAMGVAGFWNDMNEPAVFVYPSKTMPDDVQHRIDEQGFRKRTATHLEIHNVFGMENSRATYEGLLTLEPNTRPFVLTRASYAGGQRYAATWTGDNSSTWNHLRQTVPQLLNLGLSGFALSGADVGGFAGSPPPDLLTRWLELAAFQPIDRDHAAKGTRAHEPWVDGPEQEAIRRRFIEERYRLMPYLYTLAEETSRTGLPIMRPLFLEYSHATPDGHPMDLDAGSEFLLGHGLLVAASPSPEEVAPYEVHLPPGAWFDYWTGQRIDRNGAVSGRDLEIRDAAAQAAPLMVTPKLDELPIYVHAGTILPIAPLTQSTMEKPDGPLTLRVYPGPDCAGDIYEDDGHSFGYRKGQYLRSSFTCALAPDGSLSLRSTRREGSYQPWWKEIRFEVYGWTPKNTNGWMHEGNSWVRTVPDQGTGMDLAFH
jgi:alpha-glucosidase